METLKFTYSDSEAGTQKKSFFSLSEIVKHIEDFGWHGDSEGSIMQDGELILGYTSRETGLTWLTI